METVLGLVDVSAKRTEKQADLNMCRRLGKVSSIEILE